MNDAPFRQVVSAWMASEAYRRLRPPIPPGRRGCPGWAGPSRSPPRNSRRPSGFRRPVSVRRRSGRPVRVRSGSSKGGPKIVTSLASPSCRWRLRPARSAILRVSKPGRTGSGSRWAEAGGCGAGCSSRASPAGRWSPRFPMGRMAVPRAGGGHAPRKDGARSATRRRRPETGVRYTVKRYRSEKVEEGGSWVHARVTLQPINPEFEPIVLTGRDEGEVAVVAELMDVVAVGSERSPPDERRSASPAGP